MSANVFPGPGETPSLPRAYKFPSTRLKRAVFKKEGEKVSDQAERLTLELIQAEQRLNERLQIALGRHGFSTCSFWDGKERVEKTVWEALVKSEAECDALPKRVQELEQSELIHPNSRDYFEMHFGYVGWGKRSDGSYANDFANARWEGWKASRNELRAALKGE